MQFDFNSPAFRVLCYIVFYPGSWNRTIFITSSYSVFLRVSKSGTKLCFHKTCPKSHGELCPREELKRAGVGL